MRVITSCASSDIALQDGQNRANIHISGTGVPAVIIRRQRQGSVAQLSLASQFRFWHVRHANDVNPPLPVETRLSPGRKLWSLNTQVGAANMDGGSR